MTELTVLHALSRSGGTTGFYELLEESTAPGVRIHPFSWRHALIGSYDILHVHWPENFVRGSTRGRTLLKFVATTLLLFRLELFRTPVVRTVHNVRPHEGATRLERVILSGLDRRTRAAVVLNPVTPVPPDRPTSLIPHGHYCDVRSFQCLEPRPKTPNSLLYFGQIRLYKGLDDLMTAYGELDSASVSLQIVGEPQNADLVARLTSFAEGRRRVRLCLRHVADITLSRAITESSVVVLPYRQMHNSGALILALSLGAVVLAPQTPTTLLVQEEVGAEWVQLFSGEHITAADLVDALEAAATVDVARRPRFRDRDPSVVAERHLQVYRSVLGTQDLPAVGKDCIT